jgi:hypothetical protein
MHYYAPKNNQTNNKTLQKISLRLDEEEAQYYRFMQTFAKSLYVGYNISFDYTKQYDMRQQCSNYYSLINDGKLQESVEYLSELLRIINMLHSSKN